MITDEQIKQGQEKAYKAAGHNAYFGNGFQAGVNFALGHGFTMYDGSPYVAWPPLLPLLATMGHWLGVQPATLILFLNALLYGGMIYAGGLLILRHVRVKALGLWGACALLLSHAVFTLACYALSDLIYAALTVAILIALDSYSNGDRIRMLVIAALITALACLTNISITI